MYDSSVAFGFEVPLKPCGDNRRNFKSATQGRRNFGYRDYLTLADSGTGHEPAAKADSRRASQLISRRPFFRARGRRRIKAALVDGLSTLCGRNYFRLGRATSAVNERRNDRQMSAFEGKVGMRQPFLTGAGFISSRPEPHDALSSQSETNYYRFART